MLEKDSCRLQRELHAASATSFDVMRKTGVVVCFDYFHIVIAVRLLRLYGIVVSNF